jgi:hypothetical protein
MPYEISDRERDLSRLVDDYLAQHKMTEERFAWLAGISQTHVNRIRTARIRGPLKPATVSNIEAALRFEPQVRAEKKSREKRQKMVPSNPAPRGFFAWVWALICSVARYS